MDPGPSALHSTKPEMASPLGTMLGSRWSRWMGRVSHSDFPQNHPAGPQAVLPLAQFFHWHIVPPLCFQENDAEESTVYFHRG